MAPIRLRMAASDSSAADRPLPVRAHAVLARALRRAETSIGFKAPVLGRVPPPTLAGRLPPPLPPWAPIEPPPAPPPVGSTPPPTAGPLLTATVVVVVLLLVALPLVAEPALVLPDTL